MGCGSTVGAAGDVVVAERGHSKEEGGAPRPRAQSSDGMTYSAVRLGTV
jgi:hypothetical protein